MSKAAKYIKEWENNHSSKKEDKNRTTIRSLKKWTVTNEKLYNELINKDITTKELAEEVGVTTRSVERWLFEDVEPKKENKLKIKKVLGLSVYQRI